MSKWLWSGVLVFGLGAGAAALKCFWLNSQPSVDPLATITPGEPYPVASNTAPTADALPSTAAARSPVFLNEPIATRSEPNETDVAVMPMLPIFGGAEESEAGVAQAPRPDREPRRMPYADEPSFLDPVLQRWPDVIWTDLPESDRASGEWMSWSKVMRLIFGTKPATEAAEESDEPPLLIPPTPAYHHPPHCPYSGHCPYPGPYQYQRPR